MSVSIGTKIMEVLFNVQGYYAKDIHFSNDNKKKWLYPLISKINFM